MWWPWSRLQPAQWAPPAPIPDGDVVPVPGYRRWADLIPPKEPPPPPPVRPPLDEPTMLLPTVPLLTVAGWWRATFTERRSGGA